MLVGQVIINKMGYVEKPWGYEMIFAHNEFYAGKILFIREGEELSLQYHQKKHESLCVLNGSLELHSMKDGKSIKQSFYPGMTVTIPPRTTHRFKAIVDSKLIEVSTPELEDVVRLEDKYGRVKTGGKPW